MLQKRSTRPPTGGDQMLDEGDRRNPKPSLHYVTEEEFEQATMDEPDDEEKNKTVVPPEYPGGAQEKEVGPEPIPAMDPEE